VRFVPGVARNAGARTVTARERPRKEDQLVDVATLTDLLQEAEEHHGPYEATAPKHHWSGFYAAYIVAREQGSTPEEAAKAAAAHVEGAGR
jgi:hypothetical protein